MAPSCKHAMRCSLDGTKLYPGPKTLSLADTVMLLQVLMREHHDKPSWDSMAAEVHSNQFDEGISAALEQFEVGLRTGRGQSSTAVGVGLTVLGFIEHSAVGRGCCRAQW